MLLTKQKNSYYKTKINPEQSQIPITKKILLTKIVHPRQSHVLLKK